MENTNNNIRINFLNQHGDFCNCQRCQMTVNERKNVLFIVFFNNLKMNLKEMKKLKLMLKQFHLKIQKKHLQIVQFVPMIIAMKIWFQF